MRSDGAANRERILLAAEQVFGARGAAGSTDEVAALAQVGIATVFRHFPTKQDLVDATALRVLERTDAEVRSVADGTDPGEAFEATVRTLVSAGPTKVALLNVTLADGRGLTEQIIEAVSTIRDTVQVVLERAQTSGVMRRDATIDEVFMLARALALVAKPDDHVVVDRAVAIVLDGLRAIH